MTHAQTKRPQRRMNNDEVVQYIMSHGRHGALVQAFVIDALIKFSTAVAASKIEDYDPNGPVHPQAWIGVAKEVMETLNTHLNGPGLMTDADPDDDGLDGL